MEISSMRCAFTAKTGELGAIRSHALGSAKGVSRFANSKTLTCV